MHMQRLMKVIHVSSSVNAFDIPYNEQDVFSGETLLERYNRYEREIAEGKLVVKHSYEYDPGPVNLASLIGIFDHSTEEVSDGSFS